MTTPRDSCCLFAWNYRELANSLLTLFDRPEGGFEPGTLWTRVQFSFSSVQFLFLNGSSDLTTRTSPSKSWFFLFKDIIDKVVSEVSSSEF